LLLTRLFSAATDQPNDQCPGEAAVHPASLLRKVQIERHRFRGVAASLAHDREGVTWIAEEYERQGAGKLAGGLFGGNWAPAASVGSVPNE